MHVLAPNLEKRKPSSWKRRAFSAVSLRDGERCADCGCGQSFVYIDAGIGVDCDGTVFCWTYRRSFLELDHITPLSEGGGNGHENLNLLCHNCHKHKTSAERSRRLKAIFADHRNKVSVE